MALDRPGQRLVGDASPPVGLHADHLDDLAAAGHPFGKPGGIGRGNRAGFGTDALGEEDDHPCIQRIGLGQPPRGPGKVADLAGIDDTERQGRPASAAATVIS